MKRDLSNYFNQCFEMREDFNKATTQDAKDKTLKLFVIRLEREGLTKEEILSVLNIELLMEAQGNRQMISNTSAYKDAVKKALGSK